MGGLVVGGVRLIVACGYGGLPCVEHFFGARNTGRVVFLGAFLFFAFEGLLGGGYRRV